MAWWGKTAGFGALAISSSLSVANAAFAQEMASGSAHSSGHLEEIVVTARRRAESLQDAPISITAFTGDELERRQVDEISDITAFTPNLTLEGTAPLSGSNSAALVFIRGVGQTDFNQQTEPGVGIYVDGVYLGRAVGQILDILDLERVEVLRGPQGTLFGRNTIGGAVSLTTRSPSNELADSVELTTGIDNRMDAKATVNLPLADSLAVRFSGGVKNRDGYVIRQSDGLDLGDDDAVFGRLRARWRAAERLEANLSIDGTRERENGAPASLVAINNTPVPAGFAVTPLPPPDSPLPPNFPGINNCLVAGVAPPAFDVACSEGTGLEDDPRIYDEQWLPPNPFVTFADGPFVQADDFASELDLFGLSLTLDYDLGFAELKSITSYRELDSFFARDDDHSPVSVTGTSNDYEQNQVSQELQLNGESAEGVVKYTVGVYYFTEEGTDVNLVTAPLAFFQSGGSIDNMNTAAFGQTTWDLTDRLSLTAGVRYTHEEKSYTPDQFIIDGKGFFPDGLRIQPLEERNLEFDEVTPLANVQYFWTDRISGYFTYSEGYKSGGFTQRIFPPQPLIPDFAPESVNVYEIGLKSELFDQRVRLNAAGFYTDYTDVQVVVQEGFAPQTKNAAEAHISGFELELLAVPTLEWMFQLTVGYTDAEYDEVDAAALGVTEDSEFAYTPEWTLSASSSYELSLDRFGSLTPRLDWSYRSEFFADAINTPAIRSGDYGVLNLSVAWTDPSDAWLISAGVTNLTDQEYFPVASADLAVKGSAEAHYARPREWFLSARYNF